MLKFVLSEKKKNDSLCARDRHVYQFKGTMMVELRISLQSVNVVKTILERHYVIATILDRYINYLYDESYFV